MNTHGFIALTSVLTLSAIALVVTVLGSQVGLSALVRATEDTMGARACALAEACAESALDAFVNGIDAPEATEITIDDGQCEISGVNAVESGVYDVFTEGTYGLMTCEIRMNVDVREGSIIINDWRSRYLP